MSWTQASWFRRSTFPIDTRRTGTFNEHMRANPPLAMSLFSGAGGLDLGTRQAGFHNICSIELDPHCVDTLRRNGAEQVWNVDIRAINPLGVAESLGLSVGQLDLLHGGPPCQSFSQIGKRSALNDPRGMLAFKMIEFAKVLRPRAVLMEQVSNFGRVFYSEGHLLTEEFRRQFDRLGYTFHLAVLDASKYGVPQRRKRLFIVCVRRDVHRAFRFPREVDETRRVVDALRGLADPVTKGEVSGIHPNHIDVTPARDRERISVVREGEWLSKSSTDPNLVGKMTRKDTTKFRRLHREEPSLTLRCGEIFFHPIRDRYITPREAARIHGYDDDYIFEGPIRGRSGSVRNLDQHRQVANSVPPPLAAAISGQIKLAICP